MIKCIVSNYASRLHEKIKKVDIIIYYKLSKFLGKICSINSFNTVSCVNNVLCEGKLKITNGQSITSYELQILYFLLQMW